MSLKTDFNNALSTITSSTKPCETNCMDALLLALQNGSYPFVKVKKLHGHRARIHKINIKREICDIFLVLKYKDYFRYSFIQNKIRHKNYQGLGNFKIEAGQHYWMVKKPLFSYKGNTYHLLSSAIYDTVTAYSVFYPDTKNVMDFDLASAISCECTKNNAFCCCTFNEKCDSSHCYTLCHYNFKNKIVDYDSLVNVDEIENHHYFGEVVKTEDSLFSELQTLIKNSGGQDFLDFLKLDDTPDNFIHQNFDLIQLDLVIKNIIAIDCSFST